MEAADDDDAYYPAIDMKDALLQMIDLVSYRNFQRSEEIAFFQSPYMHNPLTFVRPLLLNECVDEILFLVQIVWTNDLKVMLWEHCTLCLLVVLISHYEQLRPHWTFLPLSNYNICPVLLSLNEFPCHT